MELGVYTFAETTPDPTTGQTIDTAQRLLESVGKVVRLPEKHMDAVTAISGSGPAYIFYVTEAMIEAGVMLGLTRDVATEMVYQTVYGAATMLRETQQHPTVLREQVTSPAGTTMPTTDSAQPASRNSSAPWKPAAATSSSAQ